ncbi:MAG: hypothetical protein FWC40_07060 [Proteobacteria bacterium]|nr:hypothetical protein [Pseudomonadota bacterium]
MLVPNWFEIALFVVTIFVIHGLMNMFPICSWLAKKTVKPNKDEVCRRD